MNVIDLTKLLISKSSITPSDAGCQQIIADLLNLSGYSIKELNHNLVSNLWATHGHTAPYFIFAGHTDVVAPGPINEWLYNPFEPTIYNNYLYGRGSCDMKGGIAAFVIAAINFIKKYPKHPGTIGIMITSGEEGEYFNDGTPKIIEYLLRNNIHIDYCIVGEPSSQHVIADTIKIGRRGSLTGFCRIYGKQTHIAYASSLDNPIHQALKPLIELTTYKWDYGNQFFPPTSFQLSNIHGGLGSGNVVPGYCDFQFNFRYSDELNANKLIEITSNILNDTNIKYELTWKHGGEPYFSKNEQFLSYIQKSIYKHTGYKAIYSTDGGTSDGRFISKISNSILELGLLNQTIHQINECVSISDLYKLTEIYQDSLVNCLIIN